jgi:ribosome-associated toxin RatA of RatAB toxin-antitoxin module
MGMSWAEHSVDVDAPIDLAFDAIVDYESFPGWQNAVEQVEVIDRTPEGLGQTVRLFVDAKIRKIDYTLRYGYERPTHIEWDFVEGNGMRNVDGVYTFEDLGAGRCRATYKLGADPEVPVPGFVLKRTHKQLVQRSVEDLKREAERRAAEAPPPVAPPEPAEPAAAAGAEPPAAPPEPSAEAAASSPAGSWTPLGARLGRSEPPPPPLAPSARPRSDTAPESDPCSDEAQAPQPTQEELAERAVELAGHAVRVGRGVAGVAIKTSIELSRGLAERIDRKLAGRDPYEDRRGEDGSL